MPDLQQLRTGNNRLCAEYCHQGVSFCVVYAEPDLSIEGAFQHLQQYGIPCAAVLDADLRLAGIAGATTTPEAVVLSARGLVLYRGRIDDQYFAIGKKRSVATHRDVRAALDAVLQGRPVAVARTQALGCAIPFPTNSKP